MWATQVIGHVLALGRSEQSGDSPGLQKDHLFRELARLTGRPESMPHSLSAQLPAAARLPHRSALAAWNAPKAHLSAAPQRGGTQQCG
eukprot:COSAG03_NODE_263_length_9732_cov_34.907194_6_plen_88_part_00